MDQQAMAKYREPWRDGKRKGRMANLLYDVTVNARLYKLAILLTRPNRRVAKRIFA